MPGPDVAVLECQGLEKAFSGVPVLRGAGFSLPAGHVLGVVGENGAGKSTLMNIIGGVVNPDKGAMRLNGEPYAPATPAEAGRRGIAFVHQELNLFGNLSVADNLFINGFPSRRVLGLPLIDRRAVRARARELLAKVDLAIAPETPVESLPQGERQLVEIAKALRDDARLILFDEPTTSLATREAERLFAMIARLRAAGMAVIYISHALDDVLRLCDTLLVLRDGEAVACGPRAEFTRRSLIALMVGREIEQLYPPRTSAPGTETALEARGVSQPGIVENIGFKLRRGEVLGISGLMGSGRSELARILFGLDPCARGEILLGGEPVQRLSTRERIRRGMAFLTESRREDGLFMDAPVRTNLEIVTPLREKIAETARGLRLVCADLDRQPVKQLSGGNQQKVALGKWLVAPPRVLILDEPTRGIDVGAKHEIYRLIGDLAASGVGLLAISSEIEELTGICDRILVMRRGEIAAAFERPAFAREAILGAAV
jgi:ribose transport system ATP-binding protein